MGQIRLYIPQPLAQNQEITLDERQSHYLTGVMKLKAGDTLNCFDNQSGEYGCVITQVSKKSCVLQIISHDKPYRQAPDIWLLFAPVKKDNTDFIIQKATELGVRKIIPVITRRTISERVRTDRFAAQAIEAAEQCRRTDIPEIADAVKLDDVLAKWDKSRVLYYMDETLHGEAVGKVFADAPAPCAVLVGPEGGFAPEELQQLRSLSYARGVCLGPRILRAETAVAAALSCWQSLSGDWV